MEEQNNAVMDPNEIISEVISSKLDGTVIGVDNIVSGACSKVYSVKAEVEGQPRHFAFKITDCTEECRYEDETPDGMVYGVRLSNFEPAHSLLARHHIKVPALFLAGENMRYNASYFIMEYLPGNSVRRYLKDHEDTELANLHELAGEIMGKMHNITREYYGWVGMKKPYSLDWKNAFFASLKNRLKTACELNGEIKALCPAIEKFIDEKSKVIDNPDVFVFSHPDGMQAMAEKTQEGWNFKGIIDIEDHQFTDRRFVLSGHEVAMEMKGKKVPDSFWNGYKRNFENEEVAKTDPVFKMFYLLTWLPRIESHNDQDSKETVGRIGKLVKSYLG
jgi:hypothetical protein